MICLMTAWRVGLSQSVRSADNTEQAAGSTEQDGEAHCSVPRLPPMRIANRPATAHHCASAAAAAELWRGCLPTPHAAAASRMAPDCAAALALPVVPVPNAAAETSAAAAEAIMTRGLRGTQPLP